MTQLFTHPPAKFPSTFTHVGRHLLGLAYLRQWLRDKTACVVAEFGCGPVEPGLAAALFSQGREPGEVEILAYERDAELTALAEVLADGRPVSAKTLAYQCGNSRDDGSRTLNQHFADEALLRQDCRHVKQLSGLDVYQVEAGHLSLVQPHTARLKARSEDIFSIDLDRPLDGAFMGALLVNLRRSHESAELVAWLRRLRTALLKGNGILVASVTPQDLYNQPTTIDLMQQAGFQIREIICESLAIVGQGDEVYVRGDYAVLAYPNHDWDGRLLTPPDIGRKLGLHVQEKEAVEIVWPPTDGMIPVLWQATGNQMWQVYSDRYPLPKDGERIARWARLEAELASLLLG